MKLKQAVPTITVVLAVAAAVFLAISTAINNVNIESVPIGLQQAAIFVKQFFSGGLVALAVIWLRNVWGYIEAFARAKTQGQTELEYDVNKFYKTTAYYLGNTAVIFNLAPTAELQAIGVAIVFFIDILGSVLGKIVSPPKG
jgi:hypothetical protein